MGRGLWACLLLLGLALSIGLPVALAAQPIPGTTVSVALLGPPSLEVSPGGAANFTWAVINSGPSSFTLDVSATSSDASFRVSVVPSRLSVAAGAVQEVYVNVSAPSGQPTGTATVRVRFATTAPVIGELEVPVSVSVVSAPASAGVLTAFIAVGAIIAIGFTAVLIFERTRVPDLLILILLGLLLGPVALVYFRIAFVPPGALETATPYFTAAALMIILFDGGLNLRLTSIARSLGIVGLFTGLNFVLTVFVVALVTTVFLGYPWAVGLLLGAVLGGTSSAVIIGVVRPLRVSDETKILLTLESVLTDVLCVVTVIALLDLLRGGPGASMMSVFTNLGQAFTVALAEGLLAGVGWLLLLGRLSKKPFSYMLTIAVLFILYAVSEFTGGSGAMAAFVFGLVLGNRKDFERLMRLPPRVVVDDRIKQFHAELSFVIRAFFFVFLGVVFTIQVGGGWAVATAVPFLSELNGTFLLFVLGVLMSFLGIVGVRLATAAIVGRWRQKSPAERRLLWSAMGRGLAAAVLASLPFTIPSFATPVTPEDLYYRGLMAPYQAQFLNFAFFIILLTVVTTTLGVISSERAVGRELKAISAVDREGLSFLRSLDLENIDVLERPPKS